MNFAVQTNTVENVGSNDIKMTIESSGEVGIGTDNPLNLLTVQRNQVGTTSPLVALNEASGASDASMSFNVQGQTSFTAGVDASDAGKFKISGSGSLGSSDFVTITNLGNVGIGTTTPTANFHVDGVNTQASYTNTSAGLIRGYNRSSAGGVGVVGAVNLNNTPTGGDRYGVVGLGWYGTSSNYGMRAYGFGGTNSYGIYAQAGGATNNYAGYFVGDVQINGNLISDPINSTVGSSTTYATPTRRIVRLNASADRTITRIEPGRDGQEVIFITTTFNDISFVPKYTFNAISTHNLYLSSGSDYVMRQPGNTLHLVYDEGLGVWIEVSRSASREFVLN